MIAILIAASVASAPVSVFGIDLGAPLSVPECQGGQPAVGRFAFYLRNYKNPSGTPCYKRLSAQGNNMPPVNETVHVQFPSGERLAAMNYDNIVVVQLLEGKVAFARFNTRGTVFQDDDLATFTAKFGKPAILESLPLQNGFGAKTTAISAGWKVRPGITAAFTSFSGGKYGDFSVGTAAGREALYAPVRAAIQPTVKL